ncbi:hypothetical protein JQM63_06660 [Oscillibacter valericigenes]|nr:hypothetical protein [Oscillibacter valericigenes]
MTNKQLKKLKDHGESVVQLCHIVNVLIELIVVGTIQRIILRHKDWQAV